jgi:hypothetical protein
MCYIEVCCTSVNSGFLRVLTECLLLQFGQFLDFVGRLRIYLIYRGMLYKSKSRFFTCVNGVINLSVCSSFVGICGQTSDIYMLYGSMLHKCKSRFLKFVNGVFTLEVWLYFFRICGQTSDIYVISKYAAQV